MKTILYKNNLPVEFWHSVVLCKQSLGESADARDVVDNHADVISLKASQQAAQQAVENERTTSRSDAKSVIDQFSSMDFNGFKNLTSDQKDEVLFQLMLRESRRLQ